MRTSEAGGLDVAVGIVLKSVILAPAFTYPPHQLNGKSGKNYTYCKLPVLLWHFAL
jgi:hypothetical protein